MRNTKGRSRHATRRRARRPTSGESRVNAIQPPVRGHWFIDQLRKNQDADLGSLHIRWDDFICECLETRVAMQRIEKGIDLDKGCTRAAVVLLIAFFEPANCLILIAKRQLN